MPAINGTAIIFTLDDGGTPSEIAMSTNATLNVEVDLPDASHKGSEGWAEHIHGQRSWTLDSEALTDMAAGGSTERLLDFVLNRSQAQMSFAPSAGAGVEITGTVSLSSFSLDAPNEDTSTMSASFTGDGPLNTPAPTT